MEETIILRYYKSGKGNKKTIHITWLDYYLMGIQNLFGMMKKFWRFSELHNTVNALDATELYT